MNFFTLLGEEHKAGPEIPDADELPADEKLLREKDVIGFYVSGHPMAGYTSLSQKLGCMSVFDLTDSDEYADNAKVSVLGIITSVKKKVTRSNAEMAFVTIEDMSGNIEALLFPKTVAANSDLLINGTIVLLKGRLSLREDKEPSIVCDSLEHCPKDDKAAESGHSKKIKHGLFLRVPSENSELTARAENLLAIFDGNTPAYFYYNDSKKYSSNAVAVDVNDPLIKELKRILGAENVVFQ
jgi:DNA polymerase-3 subunit alpha